MPREDLELSDEVGDPEPGRIRMRVGSRLQKAGSTIATWWYRHSGGTESRVPERREREQPERWPSTLPFRKLPKPYSRAITWRPGNASSAPRSRPYELFVTQSVLRDVRSHLITSRTGEPYGFLLGRVVYCPWTQAPYIIVDALRRETQSIPHGGDLDRFRRSWAAASREARRRLGQVIGWYHRHGVLGLRLSDWDLRLQEEFFAEPWHCALVIAPARGRVIGGFIQRSLRAHLFRKGLAPFYELVDLGAKPIDGKRPSVVDWDNYTTADAVEVLRARWPEPRPPSEASEEGAGEGTGDADGGEDERSTPPDSRERQSPIVIPRSRRRWRPTATGEPETGPDAGFVAEFARAVESPDADIPEVGRPTPGKRPRGGPKREGAREEGKARSASGGKGPRTRELDPEDVAAFTHVIWGPPRLEPEPSEEPVLDTEDHRSRALERLLSGEAPERAEKRNGPGGAATSLEAPPATEPPEIDQQGTLEWLQSLIEEHRAATESPTPSETDRPPAPATAPSKARSSADTEKAATRRPTAPPQERAAAAKEGPEAKPSADEAAERAAAAKEGPEAKPSADEAAERPAAAMEGEPARAGGAGAPEEAAPPASPARPDRGPRPSRPVLVGRSGPDPETEREAEIPVVMPTEETSFMVRIARRHGRRIAAGVLLLLVAGAAAIAIERRSGGQAPPPARARPAPASVESPAYRRLADAFESSLAAYRERSADFTLGRIDCAGLAAGLAALEQAFRPLSARATLEPTADASFPGYRTEMRSARSHFQGTGCEPPSTPGSAPGEADSPD